MKDSRFLNKEGISPSEIRIIAVGCGVLGGDRLLGLEFFNCLRRRCSGPNRRCGIAGSVAGLRWSDRSRAPPSSANGLSHSLPILPGSALPAFTSVRSFPRINTPRRSPLKALRSSLVSDELFAGLYILGCANGFLGRVIYITRRAWRVGRALCLPST